MNHEEFPSGLPMGKSLGKLDWLTALDIRQTRPKWHNIGYAAQFMVHTSLPYRQVAGSEFSQRNGQMGLTIIAPSAIGLPYGASARLILIYLVTTAKIHNDPHILLGHSFAEFMAKIGRPRTGGPSGGLTRVKEQLLRVLACNICFYKMQRATKALRTFEQIPVAAKIRLFDPVAIVEKDKAGIYVTLSAEFMENLRAHGPVPIDMRIIHQIKNSAQAIDIYTWLCYRLYKSAKKPFFIPWKLLREQFGTSAKRTADISRHFVKQLEKVLQWYPVIQFEADKNGVWFKPTADAKRIMRVIPARHDADSNTLFL